MRRKLAIGIGTAVAVLAAGGGVAILTSPSATAPAEAAPVATPTVLPPDPAAAPPRIRTALSSVDLTAGGGPAQIAQRDTRRFSLLGVSWSDPSAVPDGTIEVRTRGAATGEWSGWQALEKADTGPDAAEAAASGRRGATEPLWAGPSDGVAVRIGGKAGLTAGLRLDLIDPGAESGGRGGGEPSPVASADPSPSPTPSLSPSAGTAVPGDTPIEGDGPVDETVEEPAEAPPVVEEQAPPVVGQDTGTGVDSVVQEVAPAAAASVPTVAPTSTAPVKAQFPVYYTRTAWSADETIVGSVTDAKVVNAVWLHHTGTTNDYDCSESAAIVRAIQSNDVNVKGLSDLGYNYLVDKCGRLFEGRRGGVENAIVPAATVGFNTGYAAIAVIGNYETAASSAAVETIIAQVAAARLGRYDFNPASQGTFTAGVANDKLAKGAQITVPRLSGHRDADATVCPGANLYARLADIRARAQQMVTGLALTSVTGGGYSGGAYYVRSSAKLSWNIATPPADLARFEVLVGSTVVSTLTGDARTATVAIPAGRHGVTVRAVHDSGSTARVGVTVYGDPTAPTYRGALPLNLITGTYSTTSVPVRLGLTGTDNLRLAGYTVTSPRSATLGPVASWATTVRPGTSTWRLAARDVAGNSRAAWMSRSVVLSAETAAKRSGTWSRRTSGSYLGGKALAATAKNARLTYTFTGRSAALIFSRGSRTGKAYVYLDGRKVATVDTRATATKYRQALWVSSTAVKKHTVTIVVAGTAGRTTVVSDGLAYIR
ncbi:N-acetylmuramoyl-L-alanine amidase [Actinoplanes xinjiangensis]|uniref:N-acetylmuramoyl-L-alanine amidase n=1 Tax=Actinoplanes xinjiangensis TaxID=512350 RepID=UPI003427BC09